jgi:AcrR family transcriptional regulator
MTVPSPKRDVTRQRLLDAANRLFRLHGYEPTTAAAIAEDAGVTERTFFRYFPSKADVLVANWREHAEALREMLGESSKSKTADVVRDALVTFTDRVEAEIEAGIESVVLLFNDRAAFLAITETLMELETDLAVAIAKRSSRRVDDFDVRLAANASFSVFRAAVRAFVVRRSSSMSELVTAGMRRIKPCFAPLEVRRT